jgi:hypothetical protein
MNMRIGSRDVVGLANQIFGIAYILNFGKRVIVGREWGIHRVMSLNL